MVITMVCAISLEAQNKSFYDFNVTTIVGRKADDYKILILIFII